MKMRKNWQAHAARLHTYFDLGEGFFVKVKNLLMISAALKILGLPWWALAVTSPLLIAAYILLGKMWLQHGWQRQLKEVSVVETWQPMEIWQAEMLCRILRHHRIETNHFDPTVVPEEVRRVLASSKT